MTQGRTALKSYRATREVEYFAYESLPPRVRRALQEAEVAYSATAIAKAMNKGWGEGAILKSLERSRLARLDAMVMLKIWGVPEHSQAIVNGPTAEDMGL